MKTHLAPILCAGGSSSGFLCSGVWNVGYNAYTGSKCDSCLPLHLVIERFPFKLELL